MIYIKVGQVAISVSSEGEQERNESRVNKYMYMYILPIISGNDKGVFLSWRLDMNDKNTGHYAGRMACRARRSEQGTRNKDCKARKKIGSRI